MLPYEGMTPEPPDLLAQHLEHEQAILPSADLVQKLKEFGLDAKGPEVLKRVLVWPLSNVECNAEVKVHMLGGADLIVNVGGEKFEFSMRGRGHEPAGFASAEEFRDQINQLQRHTELQKKVPADKLNSADRDYLVNRLINSAAIFFNPQEYFGHLITQLNYPRCGNTSWQTAWEAKLRSTPNA